MDWINDLKDNRNAHDDDMREVDFANKNAHVAFLTRFHFYSAPEDRSSRVKRLKQALRSNTTVTVCRIRSSFLNHLDLMTPSHFLEEFFLPPSLSRLQQLYLSGDEAITILSASVMARVLNKRTSLERLSVIGCSLTPTSADAFNKLCSAMETLQNLRYLYWAATKPLNYVAPLSDSASGSKDNPQTQFLSVLSNLSRLQSVSLQSVNNPGVSWIGNRSGPKLKSSVLTELIAGRPVETPESSSPKPSMLTYLSLRASVLTCEDCEAIAAALSLESCRLQSLDFTNSCIPRKGYMSILLSMLHNTSLLSLVFANVSDRRDHVNPRRGGRAVVFLNGGRRDGRDSSLEGLESILVRTLEQSNETLQTFVGPNVVVQRFWGDLLRFYLALNKSGFRARLPSRAPMQLVHLTTQHEQNEYTKAIWARILKRFLSADNTSLLYATIQRNSDQMFTTF